MTDAGDPCSALSTGKGSVTRRVGPKGWGMLSRPQPEAWTTEWTVMRIGTTGRWTHAFALIEEAS